MIVGDPSVFAIESGITSAYQRSSLRALGYFVIHISGFRYGVYAPDATMLANSFDEVAARVIDRGRHGTYFAGDPNAGKIADATWRALYSDDRDEELFLGMARSEFSGLIHAHNLLWAPDGDEAFDDGSHILQLDLGNLVRLIAFRSNVYGSPDPATLRDLRLPADDFYCMLQEWHDRFEAEWATLPKVHFEAEPQS